MTKNIRPWINTDDFNSFKQWLEGQNPMIKCLDLSEGQIVNAALQIAQGNEIKIVQEKNKIKILKNDE